VQYLFKGQQTKERLDILLSLTKINSENMQEALYDHFVRGMDESAAALINEIKKPNLTKSINRLNDVASKVEKVKELDWRHLKSVK
jgi:hypothetical protein